ncbi:FadR/GntR family transcriptional regulator [Microbacterium fluvii]|uniref:FadR/GntR family transcriptional regulator n=1 Tax=Microbacterium fluvii TaxID=415215 RepID=A0ABW2HDP6_9MICO|nr:GntR family transcriptional regulator [Microbacterium fluvii]MCU4672818.1 GntR family transcriptional regulator [Microbacterium fluvii]
MPHATGRVDAARAVVFSPLEDLGRAELVEQRLTDAIVSGVLRDGERLPSETELARSLGVAVVTAREALEGMRDKGLVQTRRGRDGGSFVTYDRDAAARMLQARLRASSRIELRDLSLMVRAVAGTAAEIAADRASEDDIESLVTIDAQADLTTAGGARRALSRFQLETAAISQSPRLVHEEIRLQSEAGPLLWLCLGEQEYRDRSACARREVIAAIRAVDPAGARDATAAHVMSAFGWLVDQRARLEAEDPTGRRTGREEAAS